MVGEKTRASRANARPKARVAIVRARWNDDITLALERGALERATSSGAQVDVFQVAGSFELPGAVALLAAELPSDTITKPVVMTHNATHVHCPACGYVAVCQNCDLSLTFHRQRASLMCHYCGHEEPPYRKLVHAISRVAKK